MAITMFHENAELKNAAGRMGSIIQSVANIEEAMGRIHNKAAPSWEGRAAEQNARNFQKLRQITDTWLTDARQTKTALDTAVAAYEKTESQQVAKVSELDTKGIF